MHIRMERNASNSGEKHARWDLAWKCIIIGLLAGFMACLFRLGIDYGTNFAVFMYAFLKENPIYIFPWVVLALFSGFLIYRVIKWEPSSSGSGVPQVKGNVMFGFRFNAPKVLMARFSGGFLGGLFGLSVGREGPSVHIGAATAKVTSDHMGGDELEKRLLITSGAAAGLAAAFSAPISGMVFALEEIQHSFSKYVFLAGIAGSLAASLIAVYIFGLTPILDFMDVPDLAINDYWWLIPCGMLAGVLGWTMNYSYIKMRALYGRLPGWLAPGVVILIALPIGIYFPETLGSGEGLVGIAEKAEIGIAMILTLLIVKLFFSTSSFGCGAPGGIFMPILAVGALGGAAVGIVMTKIGMPNELVCNCAIYCMAGTLASSLRAPVTSIVLVTEMTGTLTHLLPVAICVFIAYVISGRVGTQPIYDVLLDDYVKKNPDVKEGAGESMEDLMKCEA
jgi:H+/Cl- antiporter ClcA